MDVGIHLVTFTRFALNKGAQQVVGFEPEPVNISCLKRTFAREIRSGKVALVEALGLNRVDLIKMDIEGAERHALAGAAETLKNFAPKMMLCIYHRQDDPVVIPQVVLAARSTYQMLEAGKQVYFYQFD